MILLHAKTETLIQKGAESTTHAILFSGPAGAGKLHAARYFASQKLGLESMTALDKHPYFKLISPEKNVVTIDQIRELQKFLQLKTPGKASIRRMAIIENAQTMTHEAQNALLKALEEPPADTVIVLTAPKTLLLRETIYSRVQQIPVLPIPKEQALEYFSSDFEKAEVEKAFLMSSGTAGLMHALLNEETHTLLGQINVAKQILRESTFNRLLRVDELGKQKEILPVFLHACKLICSAALHQTASKKDNRSLKQWHRRSELIQQAEAALPRSPNTKLLLTNLFLQM